MIDNQTFDRIGILTIPQAMLGDNEISYSGKMEDVFFEYDKKTKPLIGIRKISAFQINVVSAEGKPRDTFTAAIVSVRDYTVNKDEGTFSIRFKYRRVDGGPPMRTITIDPIVGHIFVDGDFIAVQVEGDADTVALHVKNRLSEFYHGNRVYWQYKTLTLNRRLDPVKGNAIDSPYYYTGTVVIGCTSQLPNTEEIENFTARAMMFFGYSYAGKEQQ